MDTSARALHDLLAVASSTKNKHERFLDVIANHFGLQGDDGAREAVVTVHRLVSKVHEDIKISDIEDQDKKILRRYMQPLDGLRSFSQFTQTINQLEKSFLLPDHIKNLTLIHLALDGKVNRYDAREEFGGVVEKIAKVKNSIIESDLPDLLKEKIVERLNQVQVSIDHVRIWGLDGVEGALAKLIGTLAIVDTSGLSEAQKKEVSPVAKVIDVACRSLSRARQASEDAMTILDKIPAISEGFSAVSGILT